MVGLASQWLGTANANPSLIHLCVYYVEYHRAGSSNHLRLPSNIQATLT